MGLPKLLMFLAVAVLILNLTSAGTCPPKNKVYNNKPACFSDADCQKYGNICCPNAYNTKSCTDRAPFLKNYFDKEAGTCPPKNKVCNNKPACFSDADCQKYGKICCPNAYNTKSCTDRAPFLKNYFDKEAGTCPPKNKVCNNKPACFSDADCQKYGKICCPNAYNTKSCTDRAPFLKNYFDKEARLSSHPSRNIRSLKKPPVYCEGVKC